MRRYLGYLADSERWMHLTLRPDDVIISTPSKCGTTWTQTIVGMLLFGRVDLGAPLSALSPWLDMQVRSTDAVVELLEAQTHRRFIKTHTPLDGLPAHDEVTYVVVIRHPLDVALSDRDHRTNTADTVFALRDQAVGEKDLDALGAPAARPEDPSDYLRWFVDCDLPPTGSGPNSLADFCEQAWIAWDRRSAPNVHLIHYSDLWSDLEGEMRRLADGLDVEVDPSIWPALVRAASLDSMRTRASAVAPDAQLGIWRSDRAFFRHGGSRGWEHLLSASDRDHFEKRLDELAGPAAAWIRQGRAALELGHA